MGYLTSYFLEINNLYVTQITWTDIGWEFENITKWHDDKYKTKNDFAKDFTKVCDFSLVNVFNRFFFDDLYKWYEYDSDMIELSKRFPDLLFELYGDGEDSDDFWKSYYRNGNAQFSKGRIVYDEANI